MEERKHICENNWYKDAFVRYEKINEAEWGWVLEQSQYSNSLDVEDGIAAEVGSHMCSHILLISHCPFCGEKLTNIEKNTW